MKNIFRFSALVALSSLMGLAACSPEGLSTDQFEDDSVVLSAFAPNPVVRGAELRIKGSNLDKIAEVQVPGAEPITDIEVVSAGRFSEIRVVIPKAGAEDVSVSGPVVIVDNNGRTYQSKTNLLFTEGIVLDSFSPAEAMPGDIITVKGDYLYNVQQVVLNNGVYVTGDQITEKSRRELKFIVPSDAVTGPVTVGDVNELDNPDGLIPNNIPSEATLTIGSPEVKSADRGMLKAGAEIKVEGTFLDMIASATVGGTVVDMELAEDNKSITVVLPATVQDGDVVLTSYAGEDFNAGAYTTVVPTQLAIKAESRYKAGLIATVTGKDLDLVSGADLAGTVLDYVYADGNISFTIPAVAVDGAVTLALANGKTVATDAVELVKPVVTSLSMTEVVAGESVDIIGEDLDLVTSVTLKGESVEYEYDETSGKITFQTVGTSVTGSVVLTCENKVTVDAGELTVTYDSYVVVSSLPTDARIGDEITMTGANFNMIEAIYFGDVKVTGYSKRADDEMVFIIPTAVETGTYNMKFVLTTGEEEACAAAINVMGALTTVVLFEGEHNLGSWSSNLTVSADKFAKMPYGAELHLEFVVVENTAQPWYQIKPMDMANWSGVQSVIDAFGSDVMQFDLGTTHASFVLSDADLQLFASAGVAFGGKDIIINKVYFTYENGDTDPIFVSDVMLVDYDDHGGHNGDWDGSWSSAGAVVDRYGDKSDQYFRVTVDQTAEVWVMNCNHQANHTTNVSPWKVDKAEDYVVKFDVMIEEGASSLDASKAAMQFVLGDGWYWVGEGFFPATTGGKWMTVSKPLSDLGLSGPVDFSSGTNGCYGSGIPAGVCLDNLRLSLK